MFFFVPEMVKHEYEDDFRRTVNVNEKAMTFLRLMRLSIGPNSFLTMELLHI